MFGLNKVLTTIKIKRLQEELGAVIHFDDCYLAAFTKIYDDKEYVDDKEKKLVLSIINEIKVGRNLIREFKRCLEQDDQNGTARYVDIALDCQERVTTMVDCYRPRTDAAKETFRHYVGEQCR